MEKVGVLMQGGVYLAKLDPAKHSEIEKIRPAIILMAQFILDVQPASVLVCPLSSQSYPHCSHLHVKLPPRDNLLKDSYALVEHCRSISVTRLIEPRIAQVAISELSLIFKRLKLMCDMEDARFV